MGIVAYVAEGQAELCEFPVGGLLPEILKFMSCAQVIHHMRSLVSSSGAYILTLSVSWDPPN